ncbi:MAG: mandelate racemase/muconate lactonizing enzyme family protein [Gaiellaceae bacterium]
MRITEVRLRRLRYPLRPPFEPAWDPEPRRAFEATLVYVDTDEGLTGIGSGDTMDGFERYADLFVGRDPLEIDRHVRVLETISFHAARYWPFEAALWDLAGKAKGVPAATLLGGAADGVASYASTADRRPAAARAESALALRERGFRALKVRIDRQHVEEGLETVEATRDAIGASMEIMVDLNQGWRMPGDVSPLLGAEAVDGVAARLREAGVLWFEEPLALKDVAGLARLRAQGGLRIAGGELARTTAELDTCLAADALDVYQPDAVLAVGPLRASELAGSVLERGLWFTPHTWTNGIGLLANLQLAAGVGGGPFLEFPFDPPGWTPERRDFMLAEPVLPDRTGWLAVPERPGLGFELDEEAVERYTVGEPR